MSVLQAAVRRKYPVVTDADAGRLLTQATWGYTYAQVSAISASPSRHALAAWVDNQLANSTPFDWPAAVDAHRANQPAFLGSKRLQYIYMLRAGITGGANDKLRCRFLQAILKFIPVDIIAFDTSREDSSQGFLLQIEPYLFGTFRQLIEAVTLTPQMATWLTFIRSQKASATNQPDENYARELMQLFTIGLWELNLDGTRKTTGTLDPSDPRYVVGGTAEVPTYDLNDVRGLARVFTGWGASDSTSAGLQGAFASTWNNPVINVPVFHENGTKTFLGVTIPANTTGPASLAIALDTLVNHSACPPFVSKSLIQNLTCSNPSPAYVARVASVFVNNGSGVRGDLKAVLRAILLDQEARSPSLAISPNWGKIKESFVSAMQVGLPFSPTRSDGNVQRTFDAVVEKQWGINAAFPFQVLKPPSVFGYYSLSFSPSPDLTALGLVAPEMQIYGESAVTAVTNYFIEAMGFNQGLGGDFGSGEEAQFDLSSIVALATPAAMVERMNVLLCGGQLSAAAKAAIVVRMGTGQTATVWAQRALRYTVSHPEYWVQK